MYAGQIGQNFVGFSVKKIAYLRKNFAERSENLLMRILYKYQLLKEFARVWAISVASISAGKVYIALPPLYKVSKKSGKKEDIVYAWEEDELEEAKKKIGRGYNVQRYKGLGEMNASQLWETTMNPETRTLIQVSIEDAAIVERRVSVLMGDKVEPRREWIEQNVQFTLEDNFAIE